jgi:hypothetical protein
MAIKHVFKSYVPYINYVTERGRTCVFREGRYETDHPEEVAELSKQIRDGSIPHLFIDATEEKVDTTLQDRIRAAQQAATLAILEEEAQKNEPQSGAKSEPQGSKTGAQAPQGTVGMTPAVLLGVTSSASLTGLASQSNGKA